MNLTKSYEKLLYFAGVLYLFFGLGRGFLVGGEITYLTYGICFVLHMLWAVFYLRFDSIKFKISFNKALQVTYLLAFINEIFLCQYFGFSRIDLFALIIIMMAITFTFWIMTFKEQLFLTLVSLGTIIYAVLNTEAVKFKGFFIVAFTLLTLWKLGNDYFNRKLIVAAEEFNKLTAFKETIGLLNHEFNNINNLAVLLLKRRRKAGTISEEEIELEKVVHRMSKLVKDLNEMKNYRSEEYTSGIKITRIRNPDQDQN